MKTLTLPIPHFGNEYIDNPSSVRIELDADLLARIRRAQTILMEEDFRYINVYVRADLLDKEGEDSNFHSALDSIKVYKHGGVYFHTCGKHDDSATLETDDFSELLVQEL